MADVAISPPISPPHNINHKRVSFGENNVKTFIYEKEALPNPEFPQPLPPKQPFTDPSAPATRVRVTTENSSEPRPIAPPTEVEEDGRRATSPPLRSYKMEEHENPFKPQDILYHEVDPIVEQYLHKPFPPSHSGSVNNTPVKHSNGHASSEDVTGRLHESAPPVTPPSTRESPAYYQNGLTRADIVADEKQYKESSQPLIDTPGRRSEGNNGGGKPVDGELPPAGQVEIVHIKKKKCGCCSLQ